MLHLVRSRSAFETRRMHVARSALTAGVLGLTLLCGGIPCVAGSTSSAPPNPDDLMPTPPKDWTRPRVADLTPEVRVLYFVPSDLLASPAQLARITQASKDVHRWYADHTDQGRTMKWAGAVETVNGYQSLSYYAVDFWGRVLSELGSRGYPIWGAYKVFAIWVKGAGQYAGGATWFDWTGNAMLGGEIFIEVGCVPTHPSLWPCTPAGAMAHELGHTFGMPHPDRVGSWGTAYGDNSLMASHWNFPERYARTWTVPSPWGLLNYERDHLSYDPVVGAAGSPYPPIPSDAGEKPDLPSPSLRLTARRLGTFDTELTWGVNGALQYDVYWSAAPDFASYAPVAGSPTSGTSLIHSDVGEPLIFFKAFEIPLSE